MEYYKKVDKSMFRYGVSIPKKTTRDFIIGRIPKPGSSRPVSLHWKKRKTKYEVSLSHLKKASGQTVCQLRWDNHNEFKHILKKEFIQSHLAIFSKDKECGQVYS